MQNPVIQNAGAIGQQKPYQPDSIDYGRVEERASQGYFRAFWSSYKGRVRGMLIGVAIGVLLGGAIGLAVAALLPEVAAVAAVAAFAGFGALMGADAYGAIGSASASRAAGLAEKHARILDPVHKGNPLSALNDKLMMDGRGQHFEFPEDRDNGKTYNWKSGLLGAGIGAGVGVLLAKTALLASLPLGSAAAAAVGLGALGLTFGIDRSYLKSLFNQVDANTKGTIIDGHRGPDLGRAQFGVIESDKQLLEHRLRRQDSEFKLEEEYHNKIFAGAMSGAFRGYAGGMVAGAGLGAAVGAVTFGAAAMLGVASVVAVGLPVVAAGFAGAGALYGAKVFGDAGREAGAESTARAIDNEFDRHQQLVARGITPQPHAPNKQRAFNLKAAIIMGVMGAAVGALLPAVGIGAVNLVLGAGAATAVSATTTAVASVIGAMFGASYGVTNDSIQKLGKVTDWMYDKSYVVHNDPGARPYVAPPATQPLLAPEQNSYLQNSITQDDMKQLNNRMAVRATQNFESALHARQSDTTTPAL